MDTNETAMPPVGHRLKVQLNKVFGYDDFRKDQLAIMMHVLEGRDCLVIMPTGGGKSMCYQLPALVSDGITLVISPLIALMADQVAGLRSHNVPTHFINSTLSQAEKHQVFKDLEDSRTKLLYISPEKAVVPRFIQYIKTRKINLIAIDEAHCISIWGNDFRPVYTQLTDLMHALPDTPVMALTATADRATQSDIIARLKLREPRIFLSSFERPNIHLEVRPAQGRRQQIETFLKQHPGEAGIIYCLSRKSTEEVAGKLRSAGFRAAHYHADMLSADRKKVQEAFQRDEIQIVCATIAFGMGIDKSNIRWVIHYNLPKNIESYYQEIGRAGRDGSTAQAVLFYNYQDINVFRKFIDESDAAPEFKNVQHQKLERIWEFTQATNCRTNLILSYFGEYRDKPCQHCDICIHPPTGFDGSKLAIQALSACRESGENLTIALLTDVLRASGRKEIMDAGLHKLPSYGAGRNLPRIDWILYLTQMVNHGILSIDYTEHSHLKLTTLSMDITSGKRKIKLTRPQNQEATQREIKPPTKTALFESQLLVSLKEWRKGQSIKEAVPAYVIFSDRVLQHIATNKPTTPFDLMHISGIGDYKREKYGQAVLKIVQDFITGQSIMKNVKGHSKLETLSLLRQGFTPDDIARQRGIRRDQVFEHLQELYLKGEEINLLQFISEPLLHEAMEGWRLSKHSYDAPTVAAFIKTPYPLYKLQLALTIIKRSQQTRI
jgi:ATP-dependent DNA helicase RecQ